VKQVEQVELEEEEGMVEEEDVATLSPLFMS